jgi:hypothetical protein
MSGFSQGFKDQTSMLAGQMDHWLELFDSEFAEEEVPLQDRPLRAMIELCLVGAFDIRFGDRLVDVSKPHEHAGTDWFRAIFAAVEHWYISRFGPAVVKSRESTRLHGAILIRGVAFALNIRAQRRKVEIEGETAWVYFEDCLHEDEDAVQWIVDGPDLTGADAEVRHEVASSAHQVATTLRFIRFRSGVADVRKDKETRKLCEAAFSYLQQASRRIVSGKREERGPAWTDLQMANEAALKAVIRRATGSQPFKHSLPQLVTEAEEHGLTAVPHLFDGWPNFNEISQWRYGQGDPSRLDKLFPAYMTTLQAVRACMDAIPPIISPGFGILIRYAPWKFRPDGVPRISDTTQAP